MNGVAVFELVQQNGYKELWNKLDYLIREEDVVGLPENGSIEILFFDLPEEFVASVTDRLKKEGVELKWREKLII